MATPRLAETQRRGSAATLVSTISLVLKAAETAGCTEGTEVAHLYDTKSGNDATLMLSILIRIL